MKMYEEFRDELLECVKKSLENSEVKVRLEVVVKNNGSKKEAIIFCDEKYNASPTVYLDDFYSAYKQGEDMNTILEQVLKMSDKHVNMPKGCIFGTWEATRERLRLKVINANWNVELLEDVPHYKMLDLAIVPLLEVSGKEIEGIGTVLIRKKFLELWGITEQELLNAAMGNAYRENYHIRNLSTVIADIIVECEEVTDWTCPLYVLSNDYKVNGATGIIRDDLLLEFAEKVAENFYVLPSSLHEVLLLPEHYVESADDLRKMVSMVNENEVTPEERLSANVYYYDKASKCLKIA